MCTGEPLTVDQSSFHTYLNSNALADWDLPPSTSGRMSIEALREEDEEEAQLGFASSSSHFAPPDAEQALSVLLASKSNGYNTSVSMLKSPHNLSASYSNPTDVSASPAAAFLSFFNSPLPTETHNQDDEGQVVSGYTLGNIIGYGSTSIIRRATSSSGNIAAVKIIRRSDLVKAGNAPQARKRLQHEANVWITLSHEHILPLFSVVHTTCADYFFTLYCPAGSLFDILKRDGSPALPQDDAGMMLRQVVRGLRYLHEVAGYVHRDMKLENVLVDEMGVCKIGDFGMCRKIGAPDDSDGDQGDYAHPTSGYLSSGIHRAVSLAAPSSKRLSKIHPQLNHSNILRHNSTRHRNSTSTNEPSHSFQPGSLPYAAPELLLPQTSDVLQPHPSQDIWALGVMLYALLTGRLPFRDSFEPRLQMKILNGTYSVPEGIGRGAERILEGCLERSIGNRWTIAMVDEVAWGVGWGAEGDDAAAHEEHDNQCPPLTPASRSRSHSRPPDVSIPAGIDWQQGEPRSRPSMDAASRRSSSRAKRSLSRAPALSSRRDESRSTSRHPRSRSPASATFGTQMPPSIITSSSSSSSIMSYGAFYDGSALEVSPSPPPASTDRGRRQSKSHHFASRSPSPSVVPTTPKDGALVALDLLESPDDLHLDPESSRGRRAIRNVGSDKAYTELTQNAPTFDGELDDADESMVLSGSLVSVDGSNQRYLGKINSEMDSLRVEPNWRRRPTSSPPTAPHSPTYLDAFLNTSAASSTTHLINRSRSAEARR